MKYDWTIKRLKKLSLKNPIMLEGLPGMGNVGKIAVDFIIESLEADKIYEIHSHAFPNYVFVNDDGLTELPKIEIYHKKLKKRDILLVSGDMQPADERGCYEFCDNLLELFKEVNGKEVITLGGIGLSEAPKKPQIYCSGTDLKFIKKYISKDIKNSKGVVGPIIGVTGLLAGMAKEKGIPALILLVETLGLPNYLGINEARALLKVLNDKLELNIDIKQLNKEIKIIEKEISDRFSKVLELEEKKGKLTKRVTDYIG